MKTMTPSEIESAASAQVEREMPTLLNGFENEDDRDDHRQRHDARFLELCREWSTHPTAPETAKHSQDAARLEELFGGGPKLPDTYWMERYAKASEESGRLRASEARFRAALSALVFAAENIEPQIVRGGECEEQAFKQSRRDARAALAEGGAK